VLDWDEPTRPPHDGVLALYHDLLALRPKLGDEVHVEAPSDTTLLVERPPVHVAVSLKGAADLELPPEAPVLLHTEQGGYTPAPRPPALTEETVSFSRPGAVVVQAE
jgi:maltooligosyltrehalose trehalohydrolase